MIASDRNPEANLRNQTTPGSVVSVPNVDGTPPGTPRTADPGRNIAPGQGHGIAVGIGHGDLVRPIGLANRSVGADDGLLGRPSYAETRNRQGSLQAQDDGRQRCLMLERARALDHPRQSNVILARNGPGQLEIGHKPTTATSENELALQVD